MKQFFEVNLYIDWTERGWTATLRDVMKTKKAGEITGSIEKSKDGIKVFQIDNSELEPGHQGKGIGLLMYELTIKRILELYDEVEFRSSLTLNDHSKSTWKALERKYYNVELTGKYYTVKRTRSIL